MPWLIMVKCRWGNRVRRNASTSVTYDPAWVMLSPKKTTLAPSSRANASCALPRQPRPIGTGLSTGCESRCSWQSSSERDAKCGRRYPNEGFVSRGELRGSSGATAGVALARSMAWGSQVRRLRIFRVETRIVGRPGRVSARRTRPGGRLWERTTARTGQRRSGHWVWRPGGDLSPLSHSGLRRSRGYLEYIMKFPILVSSYSW